MTTATHDTALAQPQGIRAAEPSLLRRMTRGLARFARRSRMSAFWGVIAGEAAIFGTRLFTSISYLWFNVVGCVTVVVVALLLTQFLRPAVAARQNDLRAVGDKP